MAAAATAGAIASNIPALAPPPGVTANFTDPPSYLKLLYGLVIFSLVMLIGVLGLRIYVKARLVKRWFLDDTLCVIAILLLIVWFGISISWRYSHIITLNEWNVTTNDMEYAHFYEWICMLVYPPCMMFAKLSVLIQIERIFAVQRDTFFYTSWITILLITLYYTSSIFVFAFQCNPPSKYWNTALEGSCISFYLLEAVQAGFNVLSDIAIAALPMWAIFGLRTRLKKRLELLAIFSCGFLAAAIGTCGLVFRIILFNKPDQMRAIFIIGCFCSAETIMVILVGCIPAISKLFFPETWGRKKSETHASPAMMVEANGDSPAQPSPPMQQRPNHFLKGRTGLQDSRWNMSNSLARYLGPARELVRDKRREQPTLLAKASQHSEASGQTILSSSEKSTL